VTVRLVRHGAGWRPVRFVETPAGLVPDGLVTVEHAARLLHVRTAVVRARARGLVGVGSGTRGRPRRYRLSALATRDGR